MRRGEIAAIVVTTLAVVAFVAQFRMGTQLSATDLNTVAVNAPPAAYDARVLDNREIELREAAALKDLHDRVDRRLNDYVRVRRDRLGASLMSKTRGKRRVVRTVKGEAKLPNHVLPCDLECRLSTCTRHPLGHAKPHEHQTVSAVRMNFSEPQPRRRAPGQSTMSRPPWPKMSKEGKFWRLRVDQSGIERWQNAYVRNALLEDESKVRGVPCTPEPFVDFAVGMREYLPPRGDAAPPLTAAALHKKDEEADELQEILQDIQHDQSMCHKMRAFDSIGRGGIGGILKFFALGFTWAYDQGAPFTCWHPRLDPLNETLWALLEPFADCDPDGEREADTWAIEYTPNFRSGKYAPAEWKHRGHFWWLAQLLKYMFRPKPHLLKQIQKERAKIPDGVPYIGMHVRHGDKCEGDRPDAPATPEGYDFRIMDDTRRMQDWRIECPSFTEFMAHAERIRSMYGIRTIWLATDDADVVDRALTDPCYAHWDFHFLDYKRLNPTDYHYEELESDGHLAVGYGLEECQVDAKNIPPESKLKCKKYRDRKEETASMIVDIALLADADAFVLAFSSNIGRVTYELATAKKQCYPPVISRDIGWCFTDGQIQEGGPYGHLNC